MRRILLVLVLAVVLSPGLALAGPATAAEVEPNATSATATPLGGTAVVVEGNVFPNADVDVYSFAATAGDRIYAAVMTSFSASGSVDSVLELLDVDGTTILETDADDGSFGTTSSSIAGRTIPSTGTFFLRVRHALATAQLRPYRLFFQQRTGSPTAETEVNDTFPGQATPAGGWVSGDTSSTTDVDFFSLTLNAGDTVFVSLDLDPERDATEWNGQLGLGTFGTPAVILVVNDAGAATPDSEAYFMTVNSAGTFGVSVGLPTGGTTFGTYHVSITVFPAVNQGVNCTTYTSTNVPVAIPTGPAIVSSTLTVPGNPRIADIDVLIDLTHNFMADLDVELTAPGGNSVGLFSDIGSVTAGANTGMSTTLDDEAGFPIGQFTVVQGPSFTPELNYRLSWFDGQPAGGTWTMTLRDDATGDAGTLNNWSIRICEPAPPAACAAGFVPVTVFTTDFESGDGGFTHSGTADEWELGNPTFAPVTGCNSGTNCWKTDLDNTYNASNNQDLLSANINLAGLSAPVIVNWAQKYQIESATFDHALIQAREVANPANAVSLFEWLGATMTNAIGNPTVTVQEAAGWGQFSARADALAGLNSELRFHLDADTTVQLGGLAIDDVSVTACQLASADLSITKTDGTAAVTAGGSTTYTIVASNAGPSAVPVASVVDNFPASLTCSTTSVAAGGATGNTAGPFGGNINDAALNLPAGSSVTYTSICSISVSAASPLDNTATISSATADPDTANNSATDSDSVTPAPADLSITKTDGVASVTAGNSTTYTIVASNPGPGAAVASVADTFPASLTCTTTSVAAGGATGNTAGPFGGNINDAAVNMPAGSSVTYTSNCLVAVSATSPLTNTATISSAIDPNPANNSATDIDTVGAPFGLANVSGSKTVSGSFTEGGAITYTVTLTNNGAGAQNDNPGDEFTDILPAGLTLVSATATGGTALATIATNTVTWNGTIASTASVTITINATVNPGTAGTTITNQGSIAYDADGNGTNESTRATDDPAQGGAADPTPFVVAGGQVTEIPTLGDFGLAALIAGLGLAAARRLRRRS